MNNINEWRTVFVFENGQIWPGIFKEQMETANRYFDMLSNMNFEGFIEGNNLCESFVLQMSYTCQCGTGSEHAVFLDALKEYYQALIVLRVANKKMKPNTKIRSYNIPPGDTVCIPREWTSPNKPKLIYKKVDNPFRNAKNKKEIDAYVKAMKVVFGNRYPWDEEDDERTFKLIKTLIWRFERVYDYPIGPQDIGIWFKHNWGDEGNHTEMSALQLALEWMMIKNQARRELYEKEGKK